MLLPGWTDKLPLALLRPGMLALGACALVACGTVGRGAAPANDAGAAAVSGAADPELQQRYDALLARLQSDDATAGADLAKFSAAHPDLAGPLLNLGLIRAEEGDESAAQALFLRATEVCSRCGPAWNELGVLGRKQGRFADAEQAYLKAIELQPDYAAAYYNLAVLYELYVPRPELALQNYERYLELGGTDSGSTDVEKWVADLRRRVGATPKTASAESKS